METNSLGGKSKLLNVNLGINNSPYNAERRTSPKCCQAYYLVWSAIDNSPVYTTE